MVPPSIIATVMATTKTMAATLNEQLIKVCKTAAIIITRIGITKAINKSVILYLPPKFINPFVI